LSILSRVSRRGRHLKHKTNSEFEIPSLEEQITMAIQATSFKDESAFVPINPAPPPAYPGLPPLIPTARVENQKQIKQPARTAV